MRTATHPNSAGFWLEVHCKVVIDLVPRSLKRRPARTLSEQGTTPPCGGATVF